MFTPGVHNYLVLGYKNENNNSGYAWKLPGVNCSGAFSGKRVANIAAISEKCSNHWEIFVTGRREEPDGRPADYMRSSSAVISANSRSRILLAILGGTNATGLKGLGTNYCIWCGTGPTVSALGVAPDGLEDQGR